MHELAVCQALIGQLEAIAGEHGNGTVQAVTVRVGPLSGVEAELLARAFTVARAGTVADGARLTIEAEPIRVRCRTCGEESGARVNRLVCGHCGDYRTTLVSGDELTLGQVVIERPDPRTGPMTVERGEAHV